MSTSKMHTIIALFAYCFLTVLQALSAGSLSLYHTSGTTFLNLQLPSRPTFLHIQFSNLLNANKTSPDFMHDIMEIVSPGYVNIDKILTGDDKIQMKSTNLGEISLKRSFSGIDQNITMEFGHMNSPNGVDSRKGWIHTDAEYHSALEQYGDLPS